jgi:hypothetical protein
MLRESEAEFRSFLVLLQEAGRKDLWDMPEDRAKAQVAT